MEQESLAEPQREEIKSFLETLHQINLTDPALLELYYSQLTKDDIRTLYLKYRLDYDLFGFTQDYFIAFGKGE